MSGYRYHHSELYSCPIHPKALELADFPFFWDVCDENAPFGSDEGYEALVYYWDWEEKNKNEALEKCLRSFLFKSYAEDTANKMIGLYFTPFKDSLKEAQNWSESRVYDNFLLLDAFIVAIGLGSFIKFGKVDSSFKKHMIYSIERMYKPTKEFSSKRQNEELKFAWMLHDKLMNIVELK